MNSSLVMLRMDIWPTLCLCLMALYVLYPRIATDFKLTRFIPRSGEQQVPRSYGFYWFIDDSKLKMVTRLRSLLALTLGPSSVNFSPQ